MCAPCNSSTAGENVRGSSSKQPDGWRSWEEAPIHTQRQGSPCLGTSIRPLGSLGPYSQIQVTSNLECVTRTVSRFSPIPLNKPQGP